MTFLVSLRMRDSCVLVEQTTGLQILTDRYSVEKSASIQLVMKKYKLGKLVSAKFSLLQVTHVLK